MTREMWMSKWIFRMAPVTGETIFIAVIDFFLGAQAVPSPSSWSVRVRKRSEFTMGAYSRRVDLAEMAAKLSPSSASVYCKFETNKATSTGEPVEATCGKTIELFLLLAFAVSLGQTLVSHFTLLNCLSRLLLCTHMIGSAVLVRRSPMRFRSLLVMFGSLLVHILRHGVSLLFGGNI
jgi:hypothetical protein